MIPDPCLPIATYHTAATIRAWTGWAKARPWWHWHPGLPACGKAAAIALPLLAIPGAVPIPLRPVLPTPGPFWAGEAGGVPGASYGGFAPGAFGPGAFGPDAYAPGAGEGVGGLGGAYGYADSAGYGPLAEMHPALVPGGLPAVGTAYPGPQGPGVQPNALLPATVGSAAAIAPLLPEGSAGPAVGGSPTQPLAFAPDTPTPAPEPASLAVFAAALLGLATARVRTGPPNPTATPRRP